jgi:hypothetical protein
MTMTNKQTGGPAFPNEGFNGWGEPQQGMTLRDYFAAKAMQACIAKGAPLVFDDVANKAYEMSDAMLKAREA